MSALADRIRGIVAPGTPGPRGPDLPDLPDLPDFSAWQMADLRLGRRILSPFDDETPAAPETTERGDEIGEGRWGGQVG